MRYQNGSTMDVGFVERGLNVACRLIMFHNEIKNTP
jgi:hypothetical protein